MNEEECVDFETAKRLKELGFNSGLEDISCPGLFYAEDDQYHPRQFELSTGSTQKDGYYLAPLWQQVEQWLWNKYKYWVYVRIFNATQSLYVWDIPLLKIGMEQYPSPLEARKEAIKTAVKILSEKNGN